MIKKLCVFCGSSSGNNSKYLELTRELGKVLVEKKIDLVYGAGSSGIMGHLADSVLEDGGLVTGVIPRDLFSEEIEHKKLTHLIKVDDMHERKKKMYELSDAFAALPGGFGTLDEFFEILTWRQLKLHPKPIYLFNFENFFGHLIEHIHYADQEGLISNEDLAHFEVINSFEDLKNTLFNF
ncbi:MAG: TIGR00730 family Rossman fold protein [Epsilonproteobacteria bacterium]|nr:MAG: TIGR00730 family Rossman fold protein [Campylobacterota bacterium]RLA67018.1 MAG: TIGR00730 family Rossman fold protein [Campylobacterota bacterium]